MINQLETILFRGETLVNNANADVLISRAIIKDTRAIIEDKIVSIEQNRTLLKLSQESLQSSRTITSLD